ncbi:MAG: glutamate-5-semialdehyde dehydrogenase, partial [Gammaproteobacteria bacterium]|nr:glutamate-5-semialdehyde dehydrogenase [Gammaproteobacteria bacterium]
MDAMGAGARRAAAALALTSNDARNRALLAAANAIRKQSDEILSANAIDMAATAERGLSDAILDRLMLDAERIEGMAAGIEAVAELHDPLGRVIAEWDRPNGLSIQRVTVPLGVIGIIYESRPNVTADAAALCLKSGNAAILRGGSESFHSSQAIYQCLRGGLTEAGVDADAVQMVPTTDRAAVGYMLSSMGEWLDVVVPRGGKSLIKRVQDEARVPVIGHLEGICHVYLHEAADNEMARDIVLNAKMRRTGICGAAETVLVDRAAAERLLPDVARALSDAGCEIRGDAAVRAIVPTAVAASEEDWSTEYLDAIISIRVVDDIEQAIRHIAHFGSGHTESIVTANALAAERFFRDV